MLILNEKKYAENIIAYGSIGESPVYDAILVQRYYYQVDGLRGEELRNKTLQLMSAVYQKYSRADWNEILDKGMKTVKRELVALDHIEVYSSELDVIKYLSGRKLQKLAFTMLCCARYCNKRNGDNNNWVNASPAEVFKQAGIHASMKEQASMYRELVVHGLIKLSKKISNTNIQVLFMSSIGNEYHITSMKNLGGEYDAILYPSRYARCERCGCIIMKYKKNARKYCKDCSFVPANRIRRFFCIDCGAEVVVISRNWRACRCEKCQTKETNRQKLLYKTGRNNLCENKTGTPGEQ